MDYIRRSAESAVERTKRFHDFLESRRELMDSDALSDDSAPGLPDDNQDLNLEEEEGQNETPPYDEYPLSIASVLQQAELHHKDTFCALTHFTKDEFDALFQSIESCFITKRGPQFFIDSENRFFLLLVYLNNYDTLPAFSQYTHIRQTMLYRALTSTANAVVDKLVELYIQDVPQTDMKFKYAKDAIGACDGSLIPLHSSKRQDVQRRFYSAKHKDHGIKLQCIVNPEGFCIDAYCGEPGSVHDLTVFKKSKTLDKLKYERIIGDRTQIGYKPVIFDRGYTGIQKLGYDEALVLKRKPRNGELSKEDEEENNRLEHDRVIVENFFGRLKTLWTITQHNFRGDAKILTTYTLICVALTNYYNGLHPMRAHSNIDANAQKAILDDSSSDSDFQPIEPEDEDEVGSNIENEEEDNGNDQPIPIDDEEEEDDDDDRPSQWLNRTNSFWNRKLNYKTLSDSDSDFRPLK